MPVADKSADKRVQRTRELLLQSLVTLIGERGYERLTIQNILDRSGVGRATFYTHFKSKDDLLESSIDGLRRWLQAEAELRRGERLSVSLPLLEHFDSHRAIYRCTIGRRGEVTVARTIRRMLRDLMRDDIAAAGPRSGGAPIDLAADVVAGVLWSTVVWWMTEAPTLPASEVNRIFRDLVFNGLAGPR